MNHVILKGRIAAEPIIDRYESGAVRANVLVRTTRYVRQQPQWDNIPVTIWQPGDDLRGAQPGRRINLVAQLRRDSYDTDDGDRKWRSLEVVAEQYWLGPIPAASAEEPAEADAEPAELAAS